MEKRDVFQEFVEIIAKLRGEGGCPWDREQTHESLKPCIMEEAAELVAAIRIFDHTGNAENMREELGDLLLQVVMQSQIASEEGLFTVEDVIREASEKMIRRHPHVFGEAEAENSSQALRNWDEIKKQEKEGKSWIESPLREIPGELPALTRASKIIKKTDKLYGDGKSRAEILKGLEEALEGLRKAAEGEKREDMERSMGDMLWELSRLSCRFRLPQEQILTDRIEDIIEKYEPGRDSK